MNRPDGNEDRSRSKGLTAPALILLAAVLATIIVAAPTPEASSAAAPLTGEAKNLAAIFVVTLILWSTEAIPIAATALLALALQPLFGVVDLRAAIQNFMGPVFIFVVAMFIIAGVVIHVGLDRRFALWLLSRAGTDSRRVLLAFMVGTALLSSIMSDVPACAVFMALGLGVLARMQAPPGKSRFGKALMMGIPIAALIGGVASPAGSSVNVLGLDQLHDFAEANNLNVHVSFLQWMGLGVPMVLILLPAAWWILVKCYPPEVDSIGAAEEIVTERAALGPLSTAEKKVIVVLCVMMVLWIAGSWVSWLDVAQVALLGAIVTFLPGVRLIDWPTAERAIGWDTLMMIGGVTALGKASMDTGLAKWFVVSCLSGIQEWDVLWLVAAISGFTVLVHLPLPIAPVVNAVLIPPVAELALDPNSGEMLMNPALLALPVAFTASCAMLLPLDAVPLLTYTKGYYRMWDMLLPGSLISLVWVIVMTLLMVYWSPVIGLT